MSERRFHPDQNLPGCMLPDGGECCAGHLAVCSDWHKQRLEIDRLRKAIADIKQATLDGKVCDDVAWFGLGETLHDFCESTLGDLP